MTDVMESLNELLREKSPESVDSKLTFRDLTGTLPEILDRLKDDPHGWFLEITTSEKSPKYVQVSIRDMGTMWAECVSNEFLDEENAWSDEENELIPTLGWSWPGPPSIPNWYFCDELLNTGSLVARILTRTLRTMFKVEPEDTVSLKVVPAPRGPKPLVRVRLQDVSVGEGRRSVYAYRYENGALAINGDDTNPGGPFETYSWTEYVGAQYFPQLLYVLGGKEEEDILAVLKEHYEDRYDDFKKILVDSGITTYLDVN